MIATRPFILYTLPKSRTTQAFLQEIRFKKYGKTSHIF